MDIVKNFLKCITGDETWVWSYALKLSSCHHNENSFSLQLIETCQMCSKVRVVLSVFFEYVEVLLDEYASPIQTLNQHLYLQVVGCLHDQCCCKLLQNLEFGKWQIYSGNVPVHSAWFM